MIRRLATQLVEAISPDPQTLVLLKAGGRGLQNGGAGMLTAWDGWTAPIARKIRRGDEIGQPEACPRVDLALDDPIAAITGSPEFPRLSDFFARLNQAERALVSADTQAVLYALVRYLRPADVIEIGTYRAATSKAMCRALHANGQGFIHTVDPANGGPILRLIRRWPAGLRQRVCYYPASSMDFFNLAVFWGVTSDLIFVDGNHDYEYALFDIQSAARLVRPGGFVAIDNINQGGPFYAARDFLRGRPSWRECGHCLEKSPDGKAFDPERSTIPGTDLCVLRAPTGYVVGERLETAGQQLVHQPAIAGIELVIARPATGTLQAQYVVRVREPIMSEVTTETSVALREANGPVRVPLPWVFAANEVPLERTIELWLGWSGDRDLQLSRPPGLF